MEKAQAVLDFLEFYTFNMLSQPETQTPSTKTARRQYNYEPQRPKVQKMADFPAPPVPKPRGMTPSMSVPSLARAYSNEEIPDPKKPTQFPKSESNEVLSSSAAYHPTLTPPSTTKHTPPPHKKSAPDSSSMAALRQELGDLHLNTTPKAPKTAPMQYFSRTKSSVPFPEAVGPAPPPRVQPLEDPVLPKALPLTPPHQPPTLVVTDTDPIVGKSVGKPMEKEKEKKQGRRQKSERLSRMTDAQIMEKLSRP